MNRILMSIITVVLISSSASADKRDQMRDELVLRTMTRAFNDAKDDRMMYEADFFRWWNGAIRKLITRACACTTPAAHRSTLEKHHCISDAGAEMVIEMAPLAAHLPAFRAVFYDEKLSAAETERASKAVAARIIDDHMPAKEVLKLQTQAQECMSR